MRNPIQVVRDWSLVKKQKAGLLDALKQTPPGACISINNPSDPIMARAIIELLMEHPNGIEMMDYGFSVTLMRKVGMHQSMRPETYANLRDTHQIITADSVVELGLKGGSQLPARKYRDGVPDDINGAEEALDISNKVIVKP